MDKLDLIKETLHKRGVSQTKLAELLGVNLTTVNNWFRRGSIPQKYIENISMLFNLNIVSNIDNNGSISENITTDIVFTTGSLQISHMDESRKECFIIDRSVIGVNNLDNIRFNSYQSTAKYVDIMNIYVDKYCGDGIYYINYPHGLIPKSIRYNLNNNTYTVIDLYNNYKMDILNLSEKIAGKVIARIEIF